MSSNQKTILFALVMCLICGYLLTFAASYLRPIQEVNIRIDKQRNVLKVLGLLEADKKYTSEDIASAYAASVKNAWITDEGQLVYDKAEGLKPIFLYYESGQLDSYVIPISGYGLWSTLYGYFALNHDGKTVEGITFYEHGETPGLGGECEKPWFQENFVGKKIVNETGEFVSISIVKGKVVDKIKPVKHPYFVDGISGATVTSKGIQTFLRKDLLSYEAFSQRLRRDKRY